MEDWQCTPQPEAHICWYGGGWVLKLRHQRKGPERRLRLATQNWPEEAGLWKLKVYQEEALAQQKVKVPLLKDA